MDYYFSNVSRRLWRAKVLHHYLIQIIQSVYILREEEGKKKPKDDEDKREGKSLIQTILSL